MSLLALFGAGYNQLARMVVAATPESADSLYPIANLYDGKPWELFRFGAAGTSGYVDFDLNQVVNGEFSTALVGGLPGAGWGKSAGATLNLTGAPSLEVQGTSDEYCYFDLVAAAGEVLTITGGAGSPVSGTALIEVRNLTTGSYLTSSETWQATSATWQTGTGSQTGTFTVEPYSTCLQDLVVLRIKLYAGTGIGPTYSTYSNLYVYPRINFAGIFGSNIQPSTAPVEIRSGTGSPAATTQATFTLAQPTMFATFASVDHRYWRLFFTADPLSSATWLGELVLGQYQTLSRAQSYPYSEDRTEPQDRSEGGFTSYLRTTSGVREMQLRFDHRAADYTQAKEMMARSRNGAHPLILADSADSGSAMVCRVADKWQASVQSSVLRQTTVTFTELPFPTVLP